MGWICQNCGKSNFDGMAHCLHCSTKKESAPATVHADNKPAKAQKQKTKQTPNPKKNAVIQPPEPVAPEPEHAEQDAALSSPVEIQPEQPVRQEAPPPQDNDDSSKVEDDALKILVSDDTSADPEQPDQITFAAVHSPRTLNNLKYIFWALLVVAIAVPVFVMLSGNKVNDRTADQQNFATKPMAAALKPAKQPIPAAHKVVSANVTAKKQTAKPVKTKEQTVNTNLPPVQSVASTANASAAKRTKNISKPKAALRSKVASPSMTAEKDKTKTNKELIPDIPSSDLKKLDQVPVIEQSTDSAKQETTVASKYEKKTAGMGFTKWQMKKALSDLSEEKYLPYYAKKGVINNLELKYIKAILRNSTTSAKGQKQLESSFNKIKNTDMFYYHMALIKQQDARYKESQKYLDELSKKYPSSPLLSKAKQLTEKNEGKK